MKIHKSHMKLFYVLLLSLIGCIYTKSNVDGLDNDSTQTIVTESDNNVLRTKNLKPRERISSKENLENVHPTKTESHVEAAPFPHKKLNQALPQKQRSKYGKLPKVSVLVNSPCQEDVSRFCANHMAHTDMGILDCLQNDDNTVKQLSRKCHHTLWQFKKNLTRNGYFSKMTGGVCQSDLQKLDACQSVDDKFKVFCLVENKESIANKQCFKFLNRIGTVIFSDYRLINKFVERCEDDIEKFNCGRVQNSGKTNEKKDKNTDNEDNDDDEQDDMDVTSQGSTIECLMKKISVLKKSCTKEVLRVAELQSDDFHLDRQLFYACREDRDVMCDDVVAGEGRVYKCLMRNKFNPKMSDNCKDKLGVRETVVQKDSKVDYVFFEQCGKSIKKFNCTSRDGDVTNHATVMLCLEGEEKKNPGSLPAECKSQLLDWRQTLLSDYKITPEIVHHCQASLPRCAKFSGEPGGVIHCLLDEVKKNPEEDDRKENALTGECLAAIENLIKVADPGSDIQVDPIVASVCHEDITKMCSKSRRGHGDVYECLLRHFADDENAGSADCREKITELAYVISKDYKYNEKLFVACRDNARKHCNADKEWFNKQSKPTVSKDHVVFNCLHDLMLNEPKKLHKPCMIEVRNVLYYSRGQLELEPWLYEPCFKDVVKFCPNHDSPGDKHTCLQKNLDNLEKDCRNAVEQFTADAQLDLQLDAIAYRTCKTVASKLCATEMEADKELDAGRLLHCMANNKFSPEMTDDCRAVIDHYQILTLKDIKASPRLLRACRDDFKKNCPDSKTGDEVIRCLSELNLRKKMLGVKNNEKNSDNNDDDDDNDNNVPLETQLHPKCAAEIRFELLQRSTNFKLDPELETNCGEDVRKFCKDTKPGKRRVINCLEENRRNLTDMCHSMLFSREKQLAKNQRMDKMLVDACSHMIKKHCADIRNPKRGLIRCLAKKMRNDDDFDSECKRVLIKRMKVRNLDIRLHPLLQKACRNDIKNRCYHVTPGQEKDSPKEFNGRVINCLKIEYAKSKQTGKPLATECETHIRDVVINSNLMYHLDPVLVGACGKEIKDKCSEEAASTDGEIGDGRVTNCLKKIFVDNKIQDIGCKKEVLRLMGEAQADVHVDPVLYRACSAELKTVCGSVLPGAGRQMSCLLWAKDDKEAVKHMNRNCLVELRSRVDMWERAAKLAPPNSIGELVDQVSSSSARNYLLAVIAMMILGIFIFGLCFGRVTKRLLVQEKNK